MRRWWTVLVAAGIGALLLAAYVSPVAGAAAPRLFVLPESVFKVRPAWIGGFTANGTAFIGAVPKRGGTIRWTNWTAESADGTGKYWVNDGIPSTAEGTLHGHRAKLHAFRVREGRYTRLTVRWYGGDTALESGMTLHVDRYRLGWNSHYMWVR